MQSTKNNNSNNAINKIKDKTSKPYASMMYCHGDEKQHRGFNYIFQ